MRIFIALDIDEAVRERMVRFMEGVRGFAPDARWVRPESLHLTLKFIGEKSAETVEQIKAALSQVSGPEFGLSFRGYGFFPTPKAARVFWAGIKAGPELEALVAAIDDATARVGVPKEEHRFSPHLTLARSAGRSSAPQRGKGDKPNDNFQRLQEKLSVMSVPEFGTMTAQELFLFESQLMRGGSKYTKLASFPLSGKVA